MMSARCVYETDGFLCRHETHQRSPALALGLGIGRSPPCLLLNEVVCSDRTVPIDGANGTTSIWGKLGSESAA